MIHFVDSIQNPQSMSFLHALNLEKVITTHAFDDLDAVIPAVKVRMIRVYVCHVGVE